jgi:hypothetical protein
VLEAEAGALLSCDPPSAASMAGTPARDARERAHLPDEKPAVTSGFYDRGAGI